MGRREVDGSSRLRAARREAQISLTDFANRVGYSRSYLSAVELGHLPETEPIVLAYESGLGLNRGSLLEGMQSVARVLDRVGGLSHGDPVEPAADRVELPVGRMVVLLRHQVVLGIATFVDDVLSASQVAGEVFHTSFSDADDWAASAASHAVMTSALHRLIGAGWQAHHLVRLSDDVGRSLQLMESVLGLLAASAQYRVLFASAGVALPAAMDCFVVAGHGAVIRFDTEDPDRQGVSLITEADGVAALVEHCRLLSAATKPLIEAIDADDRTNFLRLVVQNESEPGDRALVRGTISLTDLEPDIMDADASAEFEPSSGGAAITPYYVGDRMDRFKWTLARNRVRHIYLKAPIAELVEFSAQIGTGLVSSNADQRYLPRNVRRRIQSILALLREHPEFEVALLDPEESALIQASRADSVVYWQVQGNDLLLEGWPRIGGEVANHLHIAVHEATIAAAFMEHFKNVWTRVAPLNRDKAYVVWWFE